MSSETESCETKSCLTSPRAPVVPSQKVLGPSWHPPQDHPSPTLSAGTTGALGFLCSKMYSIPTSLPGAPRTTEPSVEDDASSKKSEFRRAPALGLCFVRWDPQRNQYEIPKLGLQSYKLVSVKVGRPGPGCQPVGSSHIFGSTTGGLGKHGKTRTTKLTDSRSKTLNLLQKGDLSGRRQNRSGEKLNDATQATQKKTQVHPRTNNRTEASNCTTP